MDNDTESIPSFFDNKPSDLLLEHRETYLMVNAISKRVRQLQLGERALALPADGSRDPMYIAQAEFLNDKLAVTPRAVGLYFEEYEDDDSMQGIDPLLALDDNDDSFDAGADDEE